MDTKKAQIIVIDFGGQYAHLIARRIRDLNVYSEIMMPDAPIDELKRAKGIILSGGPARACGNTGPDYNPEIFKLNIPIMGFCYGHQIMAKELGGSVEAGKTKEFGVAELKVTDKSSLFKGLNDDEIVWMSHNDLVSVLPPGFSVLGSTSDCEVAAMGNDEKKYYGLQFHPEVTHTLNGMKIFENFLDICGCDKDWTMHGFVEQSIKEIKAKVGDKNVFFLVSGGVDSTVAFTLVEKALGPEKVYGLHVDTGLMRKDESKQVDEAVKKLGVKNFHVVDSSAEFLKGLEGVYPPEDKRKVIGEKFIEVANKEVENLKLNADDWIIGQGTIYPDTIETAGTAHADKIKTHHNRVDIINEMIEQGKMIEPIAQLYKDEVREVGLELGLPKHMVWRHPFPGPGLGVRLLCAEKEDKLDSGVNEKINEISKKYNLTAQVLPIKSVGVQGDQRTYSHPVLLTGEADWDDLEKASTKITNKIKEVNRCIYLIVPNKTGEFKVKNAYITKERADLVREADAIAMSEIEKRNLMDEIWQMPTVLVPLSLEGGECIVLRPVYSKEAMTAKFAKLPVDAVKEIAEKIIKLDGVDAVFYDVTHKPPGTIEWE